LYISVVIFNHSHQPKACFKTDSTQLSIEIDLVE